MYEQQMNFSELNLLQSGASGNDLFHSAFSIYKLKLDII